MTEPAPALAEPAPVTDLREPGGTPGRSLPRLVRLVLTDRRIRYLMVGGVAAVTYYVIFSAGWLLSDQRIPYLAMAVIANFLCGVITYPLYRRGVFNATGPWIRGFLKFYVVCLWALGFSLVGLPLLVEVAKVPVLISQAIIIVVSPIINYQMSKYWAFRR